MSDTIEWGYIVIRRKLFSTLRDEIGRGLRVCPPRFVGLANPVKVPYPLYDGREFVSAEIARDLLARLDKEFPEAR